MPKPSKYGGYVWFLLLKCNPLCILVMKSFLNDDYYKIVTIMFFLKCIA